MVKKENVMKHMIGKDMEGVEVGHDGGGCEESWE